jgi:hypothetical protein
MRTFYFEEKCSVFHMLDAITLIIFVPYFQREYEIAVILYKINTNTSNDSVSDEARTRW